MTARMKRWKRADSATALQARAHAGSRDVGDAEGEHVDPAADVFGRGPHEDALPAERQRMLADDAAVELDGHGHRRVVGAEVAVDDARAVYGADVDQGKLEAAAAKDGSAC